VKSSFFCACKYATTAVLKHVQQQRLLAKFFVVHGGVSYEEKKVRKLKVAL